MLLAAAAALLHLAVAGLSPISIVHPRSVNCRAAPSLTVPPLLHLATVTDPSSLPPSPHLDWKKEGFLLGFPGVLWFCFWSFGGPETVVAFGL